MRRTRSGSPWPTDVAIAARATAGLDVACTVRFKLFTLDNRLIVKRIGRLAEGDRGAVRKRLGEILACRA